MALIILYILFGIAGALIFALFLALLFSFFIEGKS